MLLEKEKNTTPKGFTSTEILVTIIIIMCVLVFSMFFLKRAKKRSDMILYLNDLKLLYKAIQNYAQDFDHQYPTPNKWCDLLVDHAEIPEGTFHAFASGDPQGYVTIDPNDKPIYPVKVELVREYNDTEGKHWYEYFIRWSHYAINSDANLNSSPSTVLLFETKGGWNQFGGSEILSIDNHLSEGRKGCTVLFNDGHVEFVKPKDIAKLNWNDADNEKVGNNP